MSIFEQLGKQQREIEELFCDIRRSLSSNQRSLARVTFQLAANKLIACMKAEHAVVYPRFADIDGLVTEVAQARREHDVIEQSINRLRIGGLAGDLWDAELDHLIRAFEQHAELEELSMFPIAGLALTSKQLVKVGEDFKRYLAQSTTVAGASITYELAPSELAPPVIVRFADAPADRPRVKVAPFEMVPAVESEDETIAKLDTFEEDCAYVFDRFEAA
jgi:hypothetical protein